MSIKKNIKRVKIASDKTETIQNNLYYTRRDMGPLHIRAL